MKKTDFLVGLACGGILFSLVNKLSKSKKFEQNRQAIKEEAEKLYNESIVEEVSEPQTKTEEVKNEQEIIDQKILEIKTKVLNSRARL